MSQKGLDTCKTLNKITSYEYENEIALKASGNTFNNRLFILLK